MPRSGRPRRSVPKLTRVNVLRRDGWQCQSCGTRRGLEIHHIDRNHTNNDLDNLQTLCREHHAQTEHRFWPSHAYAETRNAWREYVRKLAYA